MKKEDKTNVGLITSGLILLIIVLIAILIAGVIYMSNNAGRTKQTEYEKCTSVCASVLSEDFTTLYLCNEECKKEFNVS